MLAPPRRVATASRTRARINSTALTGPIQSILSMFHIAHSTARWSHPGASSSMGSPRIASLGRNLSSSSRALHRVLSGPTERTGTRRRWSRLRRAYGVPIRGVSTSAFPSCCTRVAYAHLRVVGLLSHWRCSTPAFLRPKNRLHGIRGLADVARDCHHDERYPRLDVGGRRR